MFRTSIDQILIGMHLNKKVEPTKLQVVSSFIIPLSSLTLAVVALIFAILSWQRPVIPDTQQIVKLGEPMTPHVIDNGSGGREFFSFIDENDGRKIRLFALINQETVQVIQDHEGNLMGFYLEKPPNLSEDESLRHNTDQLLVHSSDPEVSGISWSSGTIYLDGYFASAGTTGVRQNTTVRSITAIDIVTAVS